MQISKPIIENLFKDLTVKSLKINGLHCYDKIECYLDLFQHEIIHVITIFCPNEGKPMGGGHIQMFKKLVYSLFVHTDYKHMLLNGDSVQYEQYCTENK